MKLTNTMYSLTVLFFLTACGNSEQSQVSEQTANQPQMTDFMSTNLTDLSMVQRTTAAAVSVDNSDWSEAYPYMNEFPKDASAHNSQFAGRATYYIQGDSYLTSGWRTYSFKVMKNGSSIQAVDGIRNKIRRTVRIGLVNKAIKNLALPREPGHLTMKHGENICQAVFKEVLGYKNASLMIDPKQLMGFDCYLTNWARTKESPGSRANQLHLFRVYGGSNCKRFGPVQLGDNFKMGAAACTDPQDGIIKTAGPNFKLMLDSKTLVFDK